MVEPVLHMVGASDQVPLLPSCRTGGAALSVRGPCPQDTCPGEAVQLGQQAWEPVGSVLGWPMPRSVSRAGRRQGKGEEPGLGVVSWRTPAFHLQLGGLGPGTMSGDLWRGAGATGRVLHETRKQPSCPSASLQVLASTPAEPLPGLQPRALPSQVSPCLGKVAQFALLLCQPVLRLNIQAAGALILLPQPAVRPQGANLVPSPCLWPIASLPTLCEHPLCLCCCAPRGCSSAQERGMHLPSGSLGEGDAGL